MSPPSKIKRRNALPPKIRVLIADDHVTVREGLSAMIGRQSDMMSSARPQMVAKLLTFGASIVRT
jgi:hypothetical protein